MARSKSAPIRKAAPAPALPKDQPAPVHRPACKPARTTPCAASPKLLLSLPREVTVSLLSSNTLSLGDYAALEATCTALREASVPLGERLVASAARVAAAAVLQDVWGGDAVLAGACAKRALRLAAALREGGKCSIAAGGFHTLALPRQLRDVPEAECISALGSLAGDWVESFNGSLLRLWLGSGTSQPDQPALGVRVFAYGTYLEGDGEVPRTIIYSPHMHFLPVFMCIDLFGRCGTYRQRSPTPLVGGDVAFTRYCYYQ